MTRWLLIFLVWLSFGLWQPTVGGWIFAAFLGLVSARFVGRVYKRAAVAAWRGYRGGR